GITVHRRVVVRRNVDRRHDGLGENSTDAFPDRQRFGSGDGRKAGLDRLARPVDTQRVRVVAVAVAHGLRDGHSRFSSSSVLMLRNASASSSKLTSTFLSGAYQASIFRPPERRNCSRLPSRFRLTRANTGCGWVPVFATATSFSFSEDFKRKTR